MSSRFTPSPTPFDAKQAPRVIMDDLRRVAAAIDVLRYVDVSDQYDLSASAAVSINADEVATAGVALLVVDGGPIPGSMLVQIDREGTTNGCWPILKEDATSTASAAWGFGSTSEPATGLVARAWIDGTSANANLVIKLIDGTNRNVRIYSVRT